MPVTMPIGMSRSVMGKSAPRPALRSRLAIKAERMPATIGPMILSRVQITTELSGKPDILSPVRDDEHPGDEHADDHRRANRDADEMADTYQRHRQAGRDLASTG